MPLITDPTLISYNGIDFTTIFRTQVKARPIYDSAGRTVKYVQLDLDVSGIVTPGVGDDGIERTFQDMRNYLSRPAGVLRYTGKGYGDGLTVNEGNVWDAKFGPQPQLLDFQPLGGGVETMLAAKVDWRCTTWIPECPGATYRFGVAELCFSQTHSVDDDGYSKIQTQVTLEIPMTRPQVEATRPPDHVDDNQYVRQLQTRVPLGFHRGEQSRAVSQDKRVLNVGWTDTQIREPPAPGCTKMPVRHEMRAQGPAFVKWEHTISGTITLPPNIRKEFAFHQFLAAVYTRINEIRGTANAGLAALREELRQRQGAAFFNAAIEAGGVVGNASFEEILNRERAVIADLRRLTATSAVVEKAVRISNGPTERSIDCSYSYFVVLRRPLVEAVRLSGMWLPIGGIPGKVTENWENWRASMERAGVFKLRGPSGIAFRKEDDAILDLCHADQHRGFLAGPPGPPQPVGGGNQGGPPAAVEVAGGAGEDIELDPAHRNYLPFPESTWIDWRCSLTYAEPIGRYARHRPLIGTVRDPRPRIDATSKARKIRKGTGGSPATATWSEEDIHQEVGAPVSVVYLKGSAVRIGAHIPLPNLLTCRGLVARRQRVWQTTPVVVQRWGDLPIIKQDWMIEFFLEAPPNGPLPILADPVLGIDGGVLPG